MGCEDVVLFQPFSITSRMLLNQLVGSLAAMGLLVHPAALLKSGAGASGPFASLYSIEPQSLGFES